MGNLSYKVSKNIFPKEKNGNANLHEFHVLQSIGKGSFGKVCVVQKKSTKQLYGLKYMSKKKIVDRSACRNVLMELEILKTLHHTFLVNLLYSFQDDGHLYLVLDLMSGGDVRYHLNQGHLFTEKEVIPYLVEIGLALDYLRSKRIVHRDLKPENLLLDSKGHIHLTDFNMATWLPSGNLRMHRGSKAYMAPQIFATNIGALTGYSYEADWWSLGITLCEMLQGSLPFPINYTMTNELILTLQKDQNFVESCLGALSSSMRDLIRGLLKVNARERVCSVSQLLCYPALLSTDLEAAKKKLIKTYFIPSNNTFNCDPNLELVERMERANLVRKKKKKKIHRNASSGDEAQDPVQLTIQNLSHKFTSFRRSCCDINFGQMEEGRNQVSGAEQSDANQNTYSLSATTTSRDYLQLPQLPPPYSEYEVVPVPKNSVS